MEHSDMCQSTLALMRSNQHYRFESMDTWSCPRCVDISYHTTFVLLTFVIWTLSMWLLFFLHLKNLGHVKFIFTTTNLQKEYQNCWIKNSIGDLPRQSFLASHVSDIICVDDGSSVPSYSFIKPPNMWGSFKLTFEQWAMAAIADTSGCVIMRKVDALIFAFL